MAQELYASQGMLDQLPVSGVALLTTFRRNGSAVGTPVGISVLDGKVYFTTWATTGKVKRLARTPRVTLAPSTRAGKATAPAITGITRRLEEPEVSQIASRLSGRFWRWVWLQIYRFVLRTKPVMYEVTPVAD